MQTWSFYLKFFFWSYQVFVSLVNLKLLLGEEKKNKINKKIEKGRKNNLY